MNIYYIEYWNWRESYFAYIIADNDKEAWNILVEEYELNNNFQKTMCHKCDTKKWVLYTDK